MRDDIHKRVPRPLPVRRWVQRAVNDADRINGRSFHALEEAINAACKREISPAFIAEMKKELGSSSLFPPFTTANMVHQLGGRGTPLEMDVLSETQRRLAHGAERDQVLADAMAVALASRCQADIRAAEGIFPVRDKKTPIVLAHMRDEAARVDYRAHAQAICAPASPTPMKSPAPANASLADVDLIANFKPKVGQK